MARLLAPTSNLLVVILLAMNVPALAVDRMFQTEVENSLKGTVPSNWWLRASWRDQTLVVFLSPSAQESFDLWYDTPRHRDDQFPTWDVDCHLTLPYKVAHK
jgi:hypothetical protein